jgi:hypothetical protein
MKTISIVFYLVFAFILTSCSPLRSPHYIGDQVEFSEKEIGRVSTWEIEGLTYHAKIKSSNQVVVASVTWDQKKEEFVMSTEDLVISALDDQLFINVKYDDSYGIIHVTKVKDDYLISHSVDTAFLKKQIPSGKVKTGGDDSSFILTGTKEEIDKFMRENMNQVFNEKNLTIAEKISEKL